MAKIIKYPLTAKYFDSVIIEKQVKDLCLGDIVITSWSECPVTIATEVGDVATTMGINGQWQVQRRSDGFYGDNYESGELKRILHFKPDYNPLDCSDGSFAVWHDGKTYGIYKCNKTKNENNYIISRKKKKFFLTRKDLFVFRSEADAKLYLNAFEKLQKAYTAELKEWDKIISQFKIGDCVKVASYNPYFGQITSIDRVVRIDRLDLNVIVIFENGITAGFRVSDLVKLTKKEYKKQLAEFIQNEQVKKFQEILKSQLHGIDDNVSQMMTRLSLKIREGQFLRQKQENIKDYILMQIAKIEKDGDKIKTFPQIDSVKFNSQNLQLEIITKSMSIKRVVDSHNQDNNVSSNYNLPFEIGQYKLVIDFLYCKTLATRITLIEGINGIHPHINSNYICYGNIKTPIEKALADCNSTIIVYAFLEILETVRLGDALQSLLSFAPLIKKI